MTAAAGVYLPARAKLNLVLRIVGRRPDGYHLLDTLFHAIELHDDLWVAPAPSGITLHVTADRPGLDVPVGSDNLVVKALTAAAEAAGATHGFEAHLHKRVPSGAGLGGGSSDAATALRLANTLLAAPLPAERLHELAARLGADVPFFLRSGSQWGRGIGDELSPASVTPLHFVLVVPPFGCPTADVYKNHASHWQSGPAQASLAHVTVPDTRDSAVRSGFCNDLEAAAERVRPELAALRRRIVDLGHGDVRMTGSGSALFLAFADAAAAAACAERLRTLAEAGVAVLTTRSAGGLDVPIRLARPPEQQAARQGPAAG